MKKIILAGCFSWFISVTSYAEIKTDGSVGVINPLSGHMLIPQTLGVTIGNNLFHSFKTFNINTGESATFTGADNIKNVMSRVTGGQISQIDGLLRSTIGGANFYFINPAGVTFGANAQIDVPAAFHVSTADTLRLTDGGQFSASNPSASNLTIAEPASFGFLGTTNNHVLIDGAKLTVNTGQKINIVAGNIDIRNSKLTAEAGSIRLVSIEKNNTAVPINGMAGMSNGIITIDNNSTLDVSGNGSGLFIMQGGDIFVSNGSELLARNTGFENASSLQGTYINAKNLYFKNSHIYADAKSQGNASMIGIKSNSLTLINGFIANSTKNSGNAGNIEMNVNDVLIDNNGIFNDTHGSGNGGAINISGNNLTLLNGGTIGNATHSTGDAGNIEVNVKNILIDGKGKYTGIYSDESGMTTDGAGNSGSITIIGDSLEILDLGRISASTSSSGNAGDIEINVKKVLINGQGQDTGIYSNQNNKKIDNGGKGGHISITGNSLELLNHGVIDTSTSSSGNAGDIKINANKVLINGSFSGIYSDENNFEIANGGNAGSITIRGDSLDIVNTGYIKSSTLSFGKAGTIDINVGKVLIDGKENYAGILSEALSLITTDVDNTGTIKIKSDNLELLNTGYISSSIVNSAKSGNIEINASNVLFDGNGKHTGVFNIMLNGGNANNTGSINITTDTFNIFNGGQVNSNALALGAGGNIIVTANNMTIDRQNSTVLTGISSNNRTQDSSAGNIDVMVKDKLSLLRGGAISTSALSTESGSAGKIKVSANNLLIDGSGIGTKSIFYLQPKTDFTNQTTSPFELKEILLTRPLSPGISSDNFFSRGHAGTVDVTANKIDIIHGGMISSDTLSSGDAGKVSVNANSISMLDKSAISSSTFAAGKAGGVSVTATTLAINNAAIEAVADDKSSGQTGDVTVTATKSLQLSNQGKITIENNATITNPSDINVGRITVSAPDIDLKDSSITAESIGNVDAGNINTDVTHQLQMDSSFISTSATDGNGGSIAIKSGELINLKNSGVLTSVTGANGNGGDINVAAKTLIMNSAAIQANAQAGTGGDIGMYLNTLITSQVTLIKGGTQVLWQPNIVGFNVIQAASALGVSGNINLTSPQFDISGSINRFEPPLPRRDFNQNPCQGAALESSLMRRGKGSTPITDAQQIFVAPIRKQNSPSNHEIAVKKQKDSGFSAISQPIENHRCTAISF